MSYSKRTVLKLLLFIATTCLVLNFVVECSLIQQQQQQQQDNDSPTAPDRSIRGQFKLPKLFEFEHFKTLFKKSYKSLLENVARQRLFLGRAFRAFISAVTYKYRKSSFYLAINQMSDWTVEEVKNIQMSREDALEMEDQISSRDAHKLNQAGDKLEEGVPVANLDDIQEKLEEISRNENREPGYKEIYDELREAQDLSNKRTKRSLEREESLRKLNLDDLIHKPKETVEFSSYVPSNNPNYEPIELKSFGNENHDEKENFNDLPVEDANAINSIPGIEFINNIVRATSNLFSALQENGMLNYGDNQEKEVEKVEEGDLKLEEEKVFDEVIIDHRESNCFFEPRDQGLCGSCYIFAPIALYEWFYCMATGNKVAFSEQYPLDCGDRLIGLKHCQGGRFNRVSIFVRLYGIELRQNYPYRSKNDTCPYEQLTPSSSMGYLKISDKGFKQYLIDNVEEQLKSTPMVMNMKLHSKFAEYGGGVDDGFDCESATGYHSVVLIGSGREDGQEYWLIRNSYSVSWGESGHYKLSKKAKCLDPNKAYTLDSVSILAQHTNPKYSGTLPLKRRYAEYMKETLRSMSKNDDRDII